MSYQSRSVRRVALLAAGLMALRPRPYRRLGALCALVSVIVFIGSLARPSVHAAAVQLADRQPANGDDGSLRSRLGLAAQWDVLIAEATTAPTPSPARDLRPDDGHVQRPVRRRPVAQPARYGPATAPLPDGKVLIAGGDDGTSSSCCVLSSAEIFDSATDTFTALTAAGESLTTPREYAAAAPLPNGDVLIGAARAADPSNALPLSSAEIFDPTNDQFTALTGPSQALTTARDARSRLRFRTARY